MTEQLEEEGTLIYGRGQGHIDVWLVWLFVALRL